MFVKILNLAYDVLQLVLPLGDPVEHLGCLRVPVQLVGLGEVLSASFLQVLQLELLLDEILHAVRGDPDLLRHLPIGPLDLPSELAANLKILIILGLIGRIPTLLMFFGVVAVAGRPDLG